MGAPLALKAPSARAEDPQPGRKPKFLITLTAYGGASIIDSLMAVRRSECPQASVLNVLEDADVRDVPGTPFRAVRQRGRLDSIQLDYDADQFEFVRKHAQDMLVMTQTVTSVNHETAQWRAMTGNGAWGGRTLQEACAAYYGESMPLPNVALTTGSGFVRRGGDRTLESRFAAEVVPDPSTWPLSLSAVAGIQGAPSPGLMRHARAMRDEVLDAQGAFGQVFGASPRLRRWTQQRVEAASRLEGADLVSKLMVRGDSAAFPLGEYGVQSNPDLERLQQQFGAMQDDPVEAQAALAFLLLKHRVASAVTLGPNASSIFGPGGGSGGINWIQTPIGFDYSHISHRGVQAFMWARVMSLADRLIELLKAEPFDDAESLWDRTVLYIATDFGRIRTRPPNQTDWSSGHDLNNGVVVISPSVRGNTILGGVDPATTLTYGADLRTGAPAPGTHFNEAHAYALVAQALGIEGIPGLPDMSWAVR